MKKVVKFGGSSLASARQFKKVADIIKSDKSEDTWSLPHQASEATRMRR